MLTLNDDNNDQSSNPDKLSDVSADSRSHLPEHKLDESGMEQVVVPINLDIRKLGPQTLFGHAKATVNTDDGSIKGIHMSRLYLALSERLEKEPLEIATLNQILGDFLQSHKGISSQATINLDFSWPIKRPALLSDNEGWRLYPVQIESRQGGSSKDEISHYVTVEITYGSFCPCSASLARQAVQQKFLEEHANREQLSIDQVVQWLGKESSITAVPHGQRSKAKIRFRFDGKSLREIPEIIDRLEKAIKTPVQTAVKRMDEQEFARLCGQNLMFVEDAVKVFYLSLLEMQDISDIHVNVKHEESLHAHDATATIRDSK